MKLAICFILLAIPILCNAENYIGQDWCNANFGNESSVNIVKYACEDLVTAKRIMSSNYGIEIFDLASKTTLRNVDNLKRAYLLQKGFTGRPSDKTVELINAYVEFLDGLAKSYRAMSNKALELGNLKMFEKFDNQSSILSNTSEELKIP